MSNSISTFRRLTASNASLESKLIAAPVHIEVYARTSPAIPLCTVRVLFPFSSSAKCFRLFVQLQKVEAIHICG